MSSAGTSTTSADGDDEAAPAEAGHRRHRARREADPGAPYIGERQRGGADDPQGASHHASPGRRASRGSAAVSVSASTPARVM